MEMERPDTGGRNPETVPVPRLDTVMERVGVEAVRMQPAKPAAMGVETVAPADPELSDFAVVLLQALIAMAARSKRGQADLTAALRGAGLKPEPARVRGALRLLVAQGAVENLVPLSDGGLLLSVTQQGAASAVPSPQWLPLGELDAGSG